jgi:pimeloyl-ACP methyl ester carboxylesterase
MFYLKGPEMTRRMLNDISFDAGRWPLKADQPTLFFIHGSGNDCSFWVNQLQSLLDCANTIAVDLPGHGSSPGDGMDEVNDYADIMASLIGEMQAPGPIPCGLSLGGAIALQMLLNGKGRYYAGILINTGARLKVRPEIFNMIKNDYNAFAEESPKMAASPHTDPDRLKDLIAGGKQCRAEVAYKDFAACDTFDVMGRLQEVSEPVLVLSAEDDPLTPPKYARYLCDGIPNSKIVNIQKAGHLSPIERPDDVNQAIRGFLAQLQ